MASGESGSAFKWEEDHGLLREGKAYYIEYIEDIQKDTFKNTMSKGDRQTCICNSIMCNLLKRRQTYYILNLPPPLKPRQVLKCSPVAHRPGILRHRRSQKTGGFRSGIQKNHEETQAACVSFFFELIL